MGEGHHQTKPATIVELITALDAESARLREMATDVWDVFRYPATKVQILVDSQRPDKDLTKADLL